MAPSLEGDMCHNPSKLRILKNLIVTSSSFVLVFTGYQGLSILQSTMNNDQGVGMISMGLMYLMVCISSLFLPKYVIQKLGCKRSMLLSLASYIPWIASNFHPRWTTLVPSSILAGVGGSILWGAQSTYFNKASVLYCSANEKDLKNAQKERIKSSIKSNCTLEPFSVQSSLKEAELSIEKANDELQCDNINQSLKDSSCILYGSCNSNNADYINPAFADVPTDFQEVVDGPEVSVSSKLVSKEGKEDILRKFAYHEAINARFFGLHLLFFRTAGAWSNSLSYIVLKLENNGIGKDTSNCSCGAYFCNSEPGCLVISTGGVSEEKRYLLTGICVAIASMAVILMLLFLDPIEKKKEPVKLSLNILMATWNQCKKKEQLLLTPITFLVGLAQGFYVADITRAYIGCACGAHMLGLVTICYALTCAVSSYMSGWFVKYIGRILIISLGVAAALGTYVLLLTWIPNPSQSYVFFLISALWGFITGTLWALIPSFYGVLFKEDEEAAFACLFGWNSLGWTFSFLYSNFLCTYIKIYILFITGLVGYIGYLITEYMFTLKKKEISQQYS